MTRAVLSTLYKSKKLERLLSNQSSDCASESEVMRAFKWQN